LQLAFYGLSGREQAIQSVKDGTSDVVLMADWFFDTYVKLGKLDPTDFVFVGPESVTLATKPYASNVYTKKLSRPEQYMSAMPCELLQP
jgi:hypothetical protein